MRPNSFSYNREDKERISGFRKEERKTILPGERCVAEMLYKCKSAIFGGYIINFSEELRLISALVVPV